MYFPCPLYFWNQRFCSKMTTASYHGRRFTLVGGAMFRSFRCLWMLEELGIPYEHIAASPQSKTILAVNPLGKVPALVEKDLHETPYFVMYESAAINTYLGDLVNTQQPQDKAHPMVPIPGTHLRGLYEQTVSCISTELDAQGLWIHRKHEAMAKYFGRIPEAVSHAKEQFTKVNAVLTQQIHSNSLGKFLVGNHFTAADILYVHCLEWSVSIGWDDAWKNDAKLCEYYKTCKQRPAYQKVAALRKKEQQQEQMMKQKQRSKL